MTLIKKQFNLKIILLFILFIPVVSAGQTQYNRLFDNVEKLYREATLLNGEILSPNYFEDAVEYLDDAKAGFDENDELKDVEEDISNAIKFFNKTIEVSNIAGNKFKNQINARNDALLVKADELAAESFEEAEYIFRKAASNLEENDIEKANSYAYDAEKEYRKAELEAIKLNICGETWKLIEMAKEDGVPQYAPKTVNKAEQLIYNAEKDLDGKRYDNDYAVKLAGLALSEIKHSIHLAELFTEFNNADSTQEDLVLLYEKPLGEIADELNIESSFEDGYVSLLEMIKEKLKSISSSTEKVNDLEFKLNKANSEINNLIAENSSLQSELNKTHLFKRKLMEIENLFPANQAEVFHLNNSVFIRLRSIKFAPGSAIIAPKHFGILTKVINAIQKFPNSIINVEGHTDASGDANKNLVLSQSRADAVRQYLAVNSKVNSKNIYAVGYGESKPIANNELDSGKARNRRIEIEIKIEPQD